MPFTSTSGAIISVKADESERHSLLSTSSLLVVDSSLPIPLRPLLLRQQELAIYYLTNLISLGMAIPAASAMTPYAKLLLEVLGSKNIDIDLMFQIFGVIPPIIFTGRSSVNYLMDMIDLFQHLGTTDPVKIVFLPISTGIALCAASGTGLAAYKYYPRLVLPAEINALMTNANTFAFFVSIIVKYFRITHIPFSSEQAVLRHLIRFSQQKIDEQIKQGSYTAITRLYITLRSITATSGPDQHVKYLKTLSDYVEQFPSEYARNPISEELNASLLILSILIAGLLSLTSWVTGFDSEAFADEHWIPLPAALIGSFNLLLSMAGLIFSWHGLFARSSYKIKPSALFSIFCGIAIYVFIQAGMGYEFALLRGYGIPFIQAFLKGLSALTLGSYALYDSPPRIIAAILSLYYNEVLNTDSVTELAHFRYQRAIQHRLRLLLADMEGTVLRLSATDNSTIFTLIANATQHQPPATVITIINGTATGLTSAATPPTLSRTSHAAIFLGTGTDITLTDEGPLAPPDYPAGRRRHSAAEMPSLENGEGSYDKLETPTRVSPSAGQAIFFPAAGDAALAKTTTPPETKAREPLALAAAAPIDPPVKNIKAMLERHQRSGTGSTPPSRSWCQWFFSGCCARRATSSGLGGGSGLPVRPGTAALASRSFSLPPVVGDSMSPVSTGSYK